jgi:hypothetical protein
VPAPDPRLRQDLVVPEDPAGTLEAHDILAAEEFAMPAAEPGSVADRGGPSVRSRWAALAGVAFLVYLARRHRAR